MFVSYGRHLQGINCLLISTCNTRLKRGCQHKTIWEWGYLIYLLDVWKKKLWMMLQFLKSDFIVMLIMKFQGKAESTIAKKIVICKHLKPFSTSVEFLCLQSSVLAVYVCMSLKILLPGERVNKLLTSPLIL